MFHHPGTEVEWSGVGDPRELGLWAPGVPGAPDLGQGEIFVGQGTLDPELPPIRMFCFIGESGLPEDSAEGLVPNGWEPPE